MKRLVLAALAAASLAVGGAHAADKVKVGFISTLSGPNAALGIDYVVFTRAKAPQGVPPAYEDERYVVIRVRQRPCGKPCAGGVEP